MQYKNRRRRPQTRDWLRQWGQVSWTQAFRHGTGGGSDWQRELPDGALRLDCRVVLETTDGALIAMTYHGIRAGSLEVLSRLSAGKPMRVDEYYLRLQPSFETGASGYQWLDNVVAVGAGHRLPGRPVYNFFQVL